MRTAVIALLFLAASAGDTDYVRCLRSKVDALELSQERPDDVVTAAIGSCRAQEPRLGDNRVDLSDTKEVLTARVVSLRACRKTAGCRPDKLPWN